MSMSDPLGDMLTRIRNAQNRRKATVHVPVSKLHGRVLEVLKNEGYIRTFSKEEADGVHAHYVVELKYAEGEPAIQVLSRVSKPGRRVYSSVRDLPRVANGLGILVVSTPKGVMSDSDARAANVGGEVLCTVF